MAIKLSKTGKNKKNQLIVVFCGGGKLVWYPTKEEIECLLLHFLIEEVKTNPILSQI